MKVHPSLAPCRSFSKPSARRSAAQRTHAPNPSKAVGFLCIFLCPEWPSRSPFPTALPPPKPVLWLLRWSTFRLLLGAGADPNMGDDLGFSPLHASVFDPDDCHECAQILVDANADLTYRKDGLTPLEYAKYRGVAILPEVRARRARARDALSGERGLIGARSPPRRPRARAV